MPEKNTLIKQLKIKNKFIDRLIYMKPAVFLCKTALLFFEVRELQQPVL